MSRKIYDVIEAVLALPRAERAVVMERLKESLEQPEVPGGIVVGPQDLVELGARYVFPKNSRYQRETVALVRKAGPTLSTKWGALAIADPWFPEAAPATPALGMGAKDYPTAVTVITRTRAETGAGEVLPVAATVGAVADVAAWQPLADDGQFQLDSDSSLGAFYEITDAAALQQLFENDLYMQGISIGRLKSRSFRWRPMDGRWWRRSCVARICTRRGWGSTRTVSRSPCFSTSACSHTRRSARACDSLTRGAQPGP